MSHSKGTDEKSNFKWGIMGSKGKTTGVQFYKSFTYDGIEYFLYDSIYLYVEDEPEPYIGKLVKIWELPNGDKKVKVVWFFRPVELVNYLQTNVSDKEIFLASGEGAGLSNTNHLEAINGKCNVVCTLKDKRNPQPSEAELKRADYFFSRTFDVGKLQISDNIGDAIADISVVHFFNRRRSEELINVPKPRRSPINHKNSGSSKSNSLQAIGDEVKDRSAICKAGLIGEEAQRSRDGGKECTPFFGETASSQPNNSFCKDAVKVEGSLAIHGEDGVKSSSVRDSKCLAVPQNVFSKKIGSLFDSDKKPGVSHLVSKKSIIDSSEHKSSSVRDSKCLAVPQNVSSKKIGLLFDSDKKPGVSQLVSKKSINDRSEHKRKGPEDLYVENKRSRDGGKECTPSSGETASSQPNNRFLKDVVKIEETLTIHREDRVKSSSVRDSKCLAVPQNVSSVKIGPLFDSEEKPGVSQFISKKSINHGSEHKRKGREDLYVENKKRVCHGKKTEGIETDRQSPDDRSKWFKSMTWEERLQPAYDKGTLVLFDNLDPSYTSEEVKDIVWQAFQLNCSVKVIPKNSFSCPYNGQAFAIFKSKEAADGVIDRLQHDCLMLDDDRLLVAARPEPLARPQKQDKFFGHLAIDKILHKQGAEKSKAVSTSHFPQANTIEYDMAVEWVLLQKQSELSLEVLHKQHLRELEHLKRKLNHKT